MTSCQLPIALEVRSCLPVKKEVWEGEGEGKARAAPQREKAGWILCLGAFISFSKAGNLRGDLRGGFQ